MDRDENDRVDCISGFNDINEFELVLRTSVQARLESGASVAIGKLFSFGLYSKSQMEIGRAIVKEDWVKKQKISCLWNIANAYNTFFITALK